MKAAMFEGSANLNQYQNWLIDYDVIIDPTLDFADRRGGNDQGKNVSDFVEREEWSPRYLKLGYFLLFQVL